MRKEIFAGNLNLPLKEENSVKKERKRFELKDKDELSFIMQGCLFLYDGLDKETLNGLIDERYIKISEKILRILKGGGEK